MILRRTSIRFGVRHRLDVTSRWAVDALERAKLGLYRAMTDSPMNPLDN